MYPLSVDDSNKVSLGFAFQIILFPYVVIMSILPEETMKLLLIIRAAPIGPRWIL